MSERTAAEEAEAISRCMDKIESAVDGEWAIDIMTAFANLQAMWCEGELDLLSRAAHIVEAMAIAATILKDKGVNDN